MHPTRPLSVPRLPGRLAVALIAAAAATVCVLAVPARAEGERTANNPFGPRSGELPDTLRHRDGMAEGATSSSRKELFTLQAMTFSLVDHTGRGQFVRPLADGAREADVRVVDKGRALDKTFLYRTQCEPRTYYFGPVPQGAPDATGAAVLPPLKPIDKGSVGELLHDQVCG
jgi:hypothetical protein